MDLNAVKPFNRSMLLENRLISRELADATHPRGICFSSDGVYSAMINEEDHLRLQIISYTKPLEKIWRPLDDVDDEIEKTLEYAFASECGYLTACPTNTGTGMRASVMLHLPALLLSEQIEKVIRGLNQLNIVMRGENGEGSQPTGAFFQMSNQQTLGVSEEEIVRKISHYAKKVCEFEKNARALLMQDTPLLLEDKILRAKAVLENCRLMGSAEAVENLSYLRLAADMGFIKRSFVEDIDGLILFSKPAHLQMRADALDADADMRDKLRAVFLNAEIRKIPNPEFK